MLLIFHIFYIIINYRRIFKYINVKNSVKYAYQMKQNLLKVNVVIIYVKIAFCN